MVHWPGDPAVRIERAQRMERGDPLNLTFLSMSAHTGTHIDAPFHFLQNGGTIDTMPLSAMMGRARVVAIEDPRSIGVEEIARHRVRRGERILLKTAMSARPRSMGDREFRKDFVYLTNDAARHLATQGIRTVGIDYLSVGGFERGNGEETHRILLGAGIWIIEGLDLSRVPPGPCRLICLPIRIERGDGAPARAFVRPFPQPNEPSGH